MQAISNEWNNEVSVLIGGSKNRQLPCIVSTTDKHDSTYSLAPTKSCSTVSAFFIQKDTYLSVVISEPDKAVALTNGTNFGAVLLSRGWSFFRWNRLGMSQNETQESGWDRLRMRQDSNETYSEFDKTQKETDSEWDKTQMRHSEFDKTQNETRLRMR